jgi:DNA topoisomerase IB
VIAEVADILGNTPAVCRASYVDPRVVSRYRGGRTIAPALKRLKAKGTSRDFADRVGIERAVIKLLA